MPDRQPVRWSGSVFLWHGRALYVGPGSDTSLHAHHAVQICFSLGRGFRLRSGPRDRWKAYRGAVVPSDRPHELDGRGGVVALLYLDAQSADAVSIPAAPSGGGIERIASQTAARCLPSLRACVRDPGDAALARRTVDEIVAVLRRRSPVRSEVDPRVERALALVDALPERRIGLPALAAQVGLSPSRFARVFRAHTGLPLRRYLLWLRLQDAVGAMAAGAPLTIAALDAGFADAAHLTRTFRRMFGLAPSELARHGQLVRVPGVEDR